MAGIYVRHRFRENAQLLHRVCRLLSCVLRYRERTKYFLFSLLIVRKYAWLKVFRVKFVYLKQCYSTIKKNIFYKLHVEFSCNLKGIDAGANLSGDLQDPASAIPKGTLMAVAITYGSYVLMGFLSAGCSLRYASGVITEYKFSENLLNDSFIDEQNITKMFDDCSGRECSFGLIPSQQMIEVLVNAILYNYQCDQLKVAKCI